MNRTKKVRFGLAGMLAAALVALGAFLLVSQASAVSGTLSISSANIPAGSSGSVTLTANVPAPGLGAWTVDITYDPTMLSVSDCSPAQSGVCNPHYASNKIRITGANATGLQGSTPLGTITFQAAAGCTDTTPLTLSTNVFADATVGNPQPITVTPTNGSVNCAPATHTPVPAATTPAGGPAATATTAPRLTNTGTGPGSNGGSSTWLFVGLAGVGLAALAGYGALRVRGRGA